ncbi:PREDICTED: uncharacterized protein LOC107337214 [Paramuricea clavata]|uniref:PREDICTED: uncharacterized protein LOC107337214 n=1 Tax=Paramuricea clavata TaxID=317549 RepID=A0A6S7FRD7_PARCT|nr:PREDICTED: uncharacterized protein LOC107337214 [Paramuricea clavata]
MSVQIKILYGPEYDRCKTSTMSTESLKKLNLERLYNVMQETVGTYYRDSKTLRIQYRDDEGTFVTITNERDVKDAARSCKTVPHEETKMIRVCLRVDDSCTPVGNASIARSKFAHPSSPPEKRPRTTVDSRKKLSFDYDQEDKIQANYSSDDATDDCSSMISGIDTPYQRYVKKVKNDIEGKKSELFELERKEHEIQRKILRVKSNPSDGKLCCNCHMRLGHTARSCEYEKCLSVFGCGEEKLHTGELDSHSTHSSIQKLKGGTLKNLKET